jgi:predicted metalloprotease with PDZ domain
MKRGWFSWLTALMVFIALPAFADMAPVKLNVDATDTARGILHTRLHIPATPGPLTLFYPKWIPGDHAPDGPINDLTGLHLSANGRPVEWRRDADDMFTFHLEVPAGADAVDVTLDTILSAGGIYSSEASSTDRILALDWNRVLLYPKTATPLKLSYAATLKLPAGWEFGTALPVASSSKNKVEFLPAPLETLIDSPVIAGEFFRTIDLTSGKSPPRFLHLAADNAGALEISPADINHTKQLLNEAEALFGAHHYRDYHFLLTVSDRIGYTGLEHHESSENGEGVDYLTDADAFALDAELLPHEMTHSWNGKFRRPAGMATPDYQQPMEDELLWVYEGLTEYLGQVLATRSGLQTNANFREFFALNAARMDHLSGREWRPVADTAVASQLVYGSPGFGMNRRRSADYYEEGALIWLEADTIIRQQTHGKKSLDDFCKKFFGGESGSPRVVPYDYNDVVGALNATTPYDWKTFFQKRIYDLAPRAPLGGIERGGWRLVYTNELSPLLKISESQRKFTSLTYSLGLTVGASGGLGDALPGSPADQAGLGPETKLVAVNGRKWSADVLRAALKSAVTNHAPIELLVVHDDNYRTVKVDYHGGEKYPVLKRVTAQPDLLDEIVKPLTPEPGTNAPSGN